MGGPDEPGDSESGRYPEDVVGMVADFLGIHVRDGELQGRLWM